MENNQQNADHGVDGGTPTAEEARLAAQVDTIGDDPQAEPDAASPPAAAPAPAPAAGDDGAGVAPAPSPAAGVDAQATPAAAAPAPAPTSEPPPALPPKPEPPKDFKSELANLQKQYDEGEIDGAEFQSKQFDLISDKARFDARLELYEERVRDAQQKAQDDWNSAARTWEQQNAEFMSNPLRANAMQQAIALVDKQTPGLPAAQLFEKAQQIVFDAYNWNTAAAPAPAAEDGAAAVAAAVKARENKGVPQTLASAPAAAQIETRGNAAFAELDQRDISDLEDTLARMSPAQLEAYLRDAPGANTNDPAPRERDDK